MTPTCGQVEAAVALFFEGLCEEPDETLSQYLITVLSDTGTNCVDTAELQEVVCGFSTRFEQLSAVEQCDLLQELLEQAHQATPATLDDRHLHTTDSASQHQETQPSEAFSHCQKGPGAIQVMPGPSESCSQCPELKQLNELCPSASSAYLRHVLQKLCHGKLEEAAQWLLDQDDLGKSEARWQAQQEQQQREAAQAAKREKESRKQLLAKYDLQAVTSGPSPVAETKRQSNSKPVSKVRYREGMVVTAKGEKYITEKAGQDWDGGSKGKVFTKGKRGKGTV